MKEASLAPLCLHMGMFGQSSCLHTTLASIEQQPLIPDDTGRRVCVRMGRGSESGRVQVGALRRMRAWKDGWVGAWLGGVFCCLVNFMRPSIVRHCVTNMGSMVSSSAVRGSIGSTGKCGRGVD